MFKCLIINILEFLFIVNYMYICYMKPITTKPRLYSYFFQELQQIAYDFGYNLLISGSLNRDCDLVLVAWIDDCKSSFEIIKEFDKILNGKSSEIKEYYNYNILPGGRESYVINMNRGELNYKNNKYIDENGIKREEFKDKNLDEEIYLDISVVNGNFYKKKDDTNWEEIKEIVNTYKGWIVSGHIKE